MKSMKAKEVLRRYAAGERDFRYLNLRGQSFQGQNLAGADFSESDIRGANFSNCNLRGAKFISVTAGLQKYWEVIFLLIFFIVFVFVTIQLSFAIGEGLEGNSNLEYLSNLAFYMFGFSFLVVMCFFVGLYNLSKQSWIRPHITSYAALIGTRFYEADLTEAYFTEAILKNTDFSNAILTRTSWYSCKQLEYARVGNSILSDASVRDLLVTGNGANKSYANANLREANLTGANLNYSNLTRADLRGANLNYSNLTRADLRGADLTNTSLTGACLEAWSIDSTTRLEKVYCPFVYLLEQPKKGTDDRERLPTTGVFAPGEFSKLFQKALDNMDLIMPHGVGWENYQALKVLEEEYQAKLKLKEKEIKIEPHELAVLEDFIREKEKFCQKLKEDYELSIKAIEDKYLAQLKSKNGQIEMYRDELARLREFTEKITQLPNIIESNQNEMKIQEIKEKYEDKIKAQDELINEYKERVNNLQKINDKNYELSLEAIERKYLAQLKGKDKEIEIYRDELAKLREIAEKMAQLPIVIQSNSNQMSNNT